MSKNVRKTFAFVVCTVAAVLASGQDVDFGDDASRWANDGECDDPRFEGNGMAPALINEDRFHDATDCSDLYDRGEIRLVSDTGIRDGLDVGDSMSAGGQYFDRYQFSVPDGPNMNYQFDLRSASLDTILRLFRQGDEDPIASNDDYRDDLGHSHISRLLSPGVYVLEVSSYSEGETGTYGLNVKQLNDVQVVPL